MDQGDGRPVVGKPNHYGLGKEWLPLQDLLAPAIKEKYPELSSKIQVDERTFIYVKAWTTLQYDYEGMKKSVEKAQCLIKQGKEKPHDLNKKYWDILSKAKKKGQISSLVSASFLVDHTIKYFKNVLDSEAKHLSRSDSFTSPGLSTTTRHTESTSARTNNIASPGPARTINIASPGPSIVGHISKMDSSRSHSLASPGSSITPLSARYTSIRSSICSPEPSASGHVSRSNFMASPETFKSEYRSRSDSTSSNSICSPGPISTGHVSRSDSFRNNSMTLPGPYLSRHTSRSASSSSSSICSPGRSRTSVIAGIESFRSAFTSTCNTEVFRGEAEDDRKRKFGNNNAPIDIRKRRKLLEQEERWKSVIVGIEDKMEALLAYCEREFKESKEIIIQMIKKLEGSEYSLVEIQKMLKMKSESDKYREIARISKDVFGDTKKQQTKKGGYVGQSDMFIYGELLKRFCQYQDNPSEIKEDIAFKPVEDSPGYVNGEPEYVESMETINTIIEELQTRFDKHAQGVHRDYKKLFRFLYYSAPIKTIQGLVPTFKVVWEFVDYLDSKISYQDLARRIEKLMGSQVSMKEINKELGKVIKVDDLPPNCKSKSGLLLTKVTEFFLWKKETIPISRDAKSVEMIVDEGLPKPYQKHIYRCYVEAAIQMNASGELEEFEVGYIDSKILSKTVWETVNFMIDCGFNMYEAIKSYISGNLMEVLKKMIKPYEGVDPEASQAVLLARLTHDFIDCIIKNDAATLPVPKTYRKLLKWQIVNLIKKGKFLREDDLHKVRINLALPKIERETLEPISPNNNSAKDDTIKEIEGIGDAIIPGDVILSKVIVIPPLKKNNFFAHVLGLPKVEREISVLIKPLAESTNSFKVEMATQTTQVHMDMTVLISVENKSERDVVRLPRGLVIATAVVTDKSAVLEEELSPGYCLQFIRHFIRTGDIHQIQNFEDHVSFGAGDNVTTFPKNQRTNFRIFGTRHNRGKQDYYTVDAIVEFFLDVKDVNTDYETYLRIVIQKGKQIVRPKDAEDLHAFLHGQLGICSRIDKSFSYEKNKELTQELDQMKKMDDNILLLANVLAELNIEKDDSKSNEQENNNPEKNPNRKLILELKDFLKTNYGIELLQIKEEMSFFIELLEECGHPLSELYLDVYAVPKYREVLKEELKIKLECKLKERGFLIGDKEDFSRLNQINKNSLLNLPKPNNRQDVESFLVFAKKFSSEIPSLEDVRELDSFIQRKDTKEDLEWTERSGEAFEEIKKRLGGVNLRPATREGKINVYTAAGTDSISSVIEQEQNGPNDQKAWYLIAHSSRMLSPEEEKMSKIEKEAHSVLWGVMFNKDTLSDKEFVLNVTSDQLGKMFQPGNSNTVSWYEQLKEYKFTVKKIKLCENPALCLTNRDINEERKPYAREILVKCLLDETLSLIKRNIKSRNEWVKFQTKQGKGAYGGNSSGPRASEKDSN